MAKEQHPETALVTGAGLRLGRAIALDLAKRGWRIGVHHHTSAAAAQALVEEIEVVRKSIAQRFTWVSSYHSFFNYDLYASFLPEKVARADE